METKRKYSQSITPKCLSSSDESRTSVPSEQCGNNVIQARPACTAPFSKRRSSPFAKEFNVGSSKRDQNRRGLALRTYGDMRNIPPSRIIVIVIINHTIVVQLTMKKGIK